MPACLHCPTFLWLPVFVPWCMFPTVGAFGPSVQPQPFARLHEACSKYRYAHPRSPTHRQWWIHTHRQSHMHVLVMRTLLASGHISRTCYMFLLDPLGCVSVCCCFWWLWCWRPAHIKAGKPAITVTVGRHYDAVTLQQSCESHLAASLARCKDSILSACFCECGSFPGKMDPCHLEAKVATLM